MVSGFDIFCRASFIQENYSRSDLSVRITTPRLSILAFPLCNTIEIIFIHMRFQIIFRIPYIYGVNHYFSDFVSLLYAASLL